MLGDVLNMIALGLATLSVLSGFFAVGNKDWWDFGSGFSEYRKGNSRALLYLLVAVTTIISTVHVVVLLDWLISSTTESLGDKRVLGRLVWHCLVASSMIGFHMWTRYHRQTRNGQPDRYFWGAGNGES